MISFFMAWGPVAVWVSLIFYLSGIPGLDTGWGVWDFILRKGAHMTEYLVLCSLLIRAMKKTRPQAPAKKIIFLSSVLSVLYACSDEFHQSFVPGRHASVGDVLIDSCGVMLLILILRRISPTEVLS